MLKRLSLLSFFLITLAWQLQAQTYRSIASGAWNNPSTWDLNQVPGNIEVDRIVISSGTTVTLTTNLSTLGLGLTIDAGGTLDANDFNIDMLIFGNFTINGTLRDIGTLTVRNEVSIYAPNTLFKDIFVRDHYQAAGGGDITLLSDIYTTGLTVVPASDPFFGGPNTLTLNGFQVHTYSGNDYFSTGSGDYEDPDLWSQVSHTGPNSGKIPAGSAGKVYIGTGHTVTLNGDLSTGSMGVEIEPGATLNAQGNDINFAGNISLNGTVLNPGDLISSYCGGTITSTSSTLPVFNKLLISDPGCDGTTFLQTDIVLLNGYEIITTDGMFEQGSFVIYPCIPPLNTTMASNALFTNQNGTSMTLSWTQPGSGTSGALVVARVSGTTQIKPNPSINYTANSVFGLGSETLNGWENYVVYKGTGNSVTITGLTPNTFYEFGVYQFAGTNCYNISSFLGASENSGVDAPPVLTFDPANGATGISGASNITITASEELRKIDNTAITAADLASLVELKLTNNAGAAVPFAATINAAKTIITIDPSSDLLSNQLYYVELNPVEDIGDNATTASNVTFTTADSEPPLVTFNPLNGATAVSNTANIILTFSEPVRRTDNTDLTSANVDALLTLKLTNASGANIAFDATINVGDTEITINPTASLPDLSVIYVAVTGVEDMSNNALVPQSITFTTTDMTPPALTFTPANGATGIAITTNIEVAFSEPVRNVDGTDLTNATAANLFQFKLTNGAGADVPFAATINAAKTIITIDPTSALLPNQLYFLRYDVVEDLFGNLTTTGNITFTTLPAPVITNFTPATICVGGSVTITGTNFGASVPGVRVGTTTATVTANTNTSITFTVPNAPSGAIEVTNTTSGLPTVSASTLTINPVPTLFSVTGGGRYCTGATGLKIGLSGSQTGINYILHKNGAPTASTIAGTGNAFDFATLITEAGTYTVTAKNPGCEVNMTGSASITVSDPPAGVGTVNGITSLCPGVTGNYTVNGIIRADSYQWNLPDGFELVSQTGNAVSILAVSGSGGPITVEGVNTCGNGGSATTNVVILSAPDVTIDLPEDAFINEAQTFRFESSASISSQSWTFGDEGQSADPAPEHIYTSSGDFTITLEVEDDKGCKSTATETLTVNPESELSNYSIKNVVTANGDEKNGVLYIERIKPGNEVIVLDRMGVEVFRKKDYNNDWDLRKGDEFLPAGNYVCVVKFEGKVYSRGVTVIKGH